MRGKAYPPAVFNVQRRQPFPGSSAFPIGGPFSALADLPRWSTCLDFLAQMNLVRPFGDTLSQDMQAISIG